MRKILGILAAACLLLLWAVGACGEAMSTTVTVPLTALKMTIEEQDIELVTGKQMYLHVRFEESVRKEGIQTLWSTGDGNVATINRFGTVTAVGAGRTKIICEAVTITGEKLRAESTIVVSQPVRQITLQPEGEITLPFDTEVELTAEVLPEDATDTRVLWSSMNEEIATVSGEGVVRGLKAGKTKILAQAADGFEAKAWITVNVSALRAEITEITLDTAEPVRVPVYYQAEALEPQEEETPEELALRRFEHDFSVSLEGYGVSWSVESEDGQSGFTLKPEAVTEETRLRIASRKNPADEVEILIHVQESAVGNAQRLPIVGAELVYDPNALMYRFELKNNSPADIGEIGFLVDYRDKFADTHYLYSQNDGTLQNQSYTAMVDIAPGQTLPLYGRTEAFRSNDVITEVRLAINYYRYVDSGEKVYIPDSQLYWYSSKTGQMDCPENERNYMAPDEETLDLAARVTYNLRATMCDLYACVAKPFARSIHPGRYIAAVGADGLAAMWGLRNQDVIYGADGILWEEDPFMLERAFAKVYRGEKVILQIVRNGEEMEIPISRN